jgi:hypothetical protein
MQKKGELAFSTIVVAIIALTILFLILIWLVPSFSDIFNRTDDVKDASIGGNDELYRLECERMCAVGNKDVCTASLPVGNNGKACVDSVNGYGVPCERLCGTTLDLEKEALKCELLCVANNDVVCDITAGPDNDCTDYGVPCEDLCVEA